MTKRIPRQRLLEMLSDGSVEERLRAACDLWRYRPSAESTQKLIQALEDEDYNVRYLAAFALGEHRVRSAAEVLIRHALDSAEDAEVRQSCVKSLGKIGDHRATPVLVQLLGNPSPDIQEHACWALADLGDVRAVQALMDATVSECSNVRWSAALALWCMRVPEVRDVLLGFQHDEMIPEDLRADIPEMLAAVPEEPTVEPESDGV